jgi:hypothetical protein
MGADVAFRDAHAPQPNSRGDKPFAVMLQGRIYTDRADAAPPFADAIRRGADELFARAVSAGSSSSTPIAIYRGFEVTVRPSTGGAIRLGMRCPEGHEALEYATARTLDVDQVAVYGTGLFQRLDHLLEALTAELKAAQDGLAREETNLTSYTEQLAKPFDHYEVLAAANLELARIDKKLTTQMGDYSGAPNSTDVAAA